MSLLWLGSITSGSRLRARLGGVAGRGLFDFDLDDAQVAGADILADVHAAGGAPGDVAGLPVKVLGGRVGVRDVLIGAVQVDHHAIDVVLVERRLPVRRIHRVEDADARIVHHRGALGDEPERE